MEISYVELMPAEFKEDTLYISKEYGTVIHLCACGCHEKTVTPIGQIGVHNWILSETASGISLTPSILNSGLECKSHYWIKNSKVIWC